MADASRTREDIESLIHGLYRQLGGNPVEIRIKPQHGGWGDALVYKITRSDGAETGILRQHIDDKRCDKIAAALKFLLQ